MFEGKTLRPYAIPGAIALPDPAADPCALRELSWGELSARLSAAHDFRTVRGGDHAFDASFDSGSAQWIASHPFANGNCGAADGCGDGFGDGCGDSGVNLEASVKCKWAAGNMVPAQRNASGDPRN
jgi:hypothetical protein